MKQLLKKWWLLLLVATALLGSGCSMQQVSTTLESGIDQIETEFSNAVSSGSAGELEKNVRIPVQLSKHIDGDTSKFLLNDQEITVRYLLIDTPETVKPNTVVQPFGSEASNKTKELLETASVIEIMLDKGKETDKYDRFLSYVFIDGELVQDILVREGLARVAYVHEPSTTYLQKLEQSQEQAKQQKIGIWSIEGYVTDKGYQD
ncbi:thermonuclease family protein [Enterococcus sp. DIV2324]|uniref:thermonuclease family protein n=1 Tax=Enterococcus sp. DIV2324 TaxID=2774763 RepID=UPI003F200F23